MALFDRTAKHLARGPAVLFPADPAAAMADAALRYDPAAGVQSGKFVFRNHVELHGPGCPPGRPPGTTRRSPRAAPAGPARTA